MKKTITQQISRSTTNTALSKLVWCLPMRTVESNYKRTSNALSRIVMKEVEKASGTGNAISEPYSSDMEIIAPEEKVAITWTTPIA